MTPSQAEQLIRDNASDPAKCVKMLGEHIAFEVEPKPPTPGKRLADDIIFVDSRLGQFAIAMRDGLFPKNHWLLRDCPNEELAIAKIEHLREAITPWLDQLYQQGIVEGRKQATTSTEKSQYWSDLMDGKFTGKR